MSEYNENSNKNILLMMAAFIVSGLIIGAISGYIITNKYMHTKVLEEMKEYGYVLTTDATATVEDIVAGTNAYVNGKLVAGSLMVFDTSDANATSDKILEGKTAYVNGKLVTGTVKVYSEEKITPETIAKVIPKGCYISKSVTVIGDPNLKPENILQYKMIFGVIGNMQPSYGSSGSESGTGSEGN